MNKENQIVAEEDINSVPVYGEEGFKGMHRAGELAARTLDYITDFVKPGITTEELNTLCHDFIIKNNAIPAPLNYRGFPKSICTSINHVVCHGIPGPRVLRGGEILNIDVTVILHGWYGDTSRMFYIGKPSKKSQLLVETTYEAMMRGIEVVKPGATLGDIGYAIQSFAEKRGFSLVRDFCGHGLGRVFHGPPSVVHFGEPGQGMPLKKGMFFTIEPMVNAGKWQVKILSDNWTAVTRDKSLSAQFEHSIGVTENGYEIFTLSSKGYACPPFS